MEKSRKKYQSTKDYSKKYNMKNINVQISRDLILDLRKNIGEISIKSYIEKLISVDLKTFETNT